MSKRRTSSDSSLPLFDLPLRPEEEARGDGATPEPPAPPPSPPEPPSPPPPPEPSPPKTRPTEPKPAPSPLSTELKRAEQPSLFSPEDLEPPPDPGLEEPISDAPPVQDRLLGGLADLVLVVTAVGFMILGTQLMKVPVNGEDWAPFLLFGLFFSFPYAVIPLAFWGKTPGMAWVGHAARTLDGEPLTFGQTARRWLASLVTVALAGLPLLLALGGRRSLADRLSESQTLEQP